MTYSLVVKADSLEELTSLIKAEADKLCEGDLQPTDGVKLLELPWDRYEIDNRELSARELELKTELAEMALSRIDSASAEITAELLLAQAKQELWQLARGAGPQEAVTIELAIEMAKRHRVKRLLSRGLRVGWMPDEGYSFFTHQDRVALAMISHLELSRAAFLRDDDRFLGIDGVLTV